MTTPIYTSRKGPCTVPDCDKPRTARGLCRTHYNQEMGYGWYADRKPKDHNAISYSAAHKRVVAKYGFPSSYECDECLEPATDWALIDKGSATHIDEKGRPYSLNPDNYAPLCKTCHNRLDNQ